MKRQRRKGVGNRKNQMDVRNRQEFLLAGRQPLLPGMVQTLRTMPVAAANGELTISCLMVSIFLW
jgi:hypothetical protein